MKYTKEELDLYGENSYNDGVDKGFYQGIALMCVIFIPLTIYFVVVINKLLTVV